MPNKTKSNTGAAFAADDEFIQACSNKAVDKIKSQVKAICEQVFEGFKTKNVEEIAALKAQVLELQQSQEFICAQYDNMKTENDKLKTINEEQTNELNLLKDCSTDSKQKADAEASKLDGIDQYSRRQNLEFEGVSVSENENVVHVVVKIGKLVGANVKPSDISAAHRLPPKRYSRISKPPAIIARFISRNVRNDMEKAKLFINENLTQARKRLLWQSKQVAKENGYAYIWTMNGKTYVRKKLMNGS